MSLSGPDASGAGTAGHSGEVAAGLSATIGVDRGGFALDAEVTVSPHEVLAVLGPNGAGKTTLLRTVAGLTPLTSGRIVLGDRTLDDPDAGVWVTAERRNMGVVFQDYLLFPHLSAVDNVAFGLRARGTGRAAARAAAMDWLERFEVASHARRRPGQLSGGQAQRVALARALVFAPDLVLLDEPLAALDAGTRLRLRGQLRAHLTSYGGPSLVVTHDPIEAMILADRLVVLEQGRIVQQGSPGEVARHPVTDYVAGLVGLNLYRGTAEAGVVSLADGGSFVVADRAIAGPVHVALRPSAIALHRIEPSPGSPRNTWRGQVSGVEPLGDRVRVAVDATPTAFADITADALADLDLTAGTDVWLTTKAADLTVYPA